MTQHRLPFGNNWGGRRKGAGRKPKGERALNPRSRRPDFKADQPVHVTLRIAEGLPALRRPLAANDSLSAATVRVPVPPDWSRRRRRSGGG